MDDTPAKLDAISQLLCRGSEARGKPDVQRAILKEVEEFLGRVTTTADRYTLKLVRRGLLWDLGDPGFLAEFCAELESRSEPDQTGLFLELSSFLRMRHEPQFKPYLELVSDYSPDVLAACEVIEAIARYTPTKDLLAAYPEVVEPLRAFASVIDVQTGTTDELLALFRDYVQDRRLLAKLRHYNEPVELEEFKTEYWRERAANQVE